MRQHRIGGRLNGCSVCFVSFCHELMTKIQFIAELQVLKFTVINLSTATIRLAYKL